MPTATLIGHTEICLTCKREFDSDQTHKCFRCGAYICPHCKACSCFKTDGDIPWEELIEPLPEWILKPGTKMQPLEK